MPYQPDRPPATPPVGADPLLWNLAHALWTVHVHDGWGKCLHCLPRVSYPCEAAELAQQGMRAAVDRGEHPYRLTGP